MELRKVYSTGTIIAICVIIVTIHAASAAPMVSVEPSYLSVSQGDVFTVNITIDPEGDEVMGAQYDLCFNNALLRAIDQTSGEFLSQDGVSTNLYTDEIDNALGRIEYSETRTGVDYGVTNPGVLATIKFEIRCPAGVSELHLDKVKLSDPVPTYISGITVNNATVTIAQSQPVTPFLIHGYVSCENGSDCNDLTVNITNLNIGKDWAAVAAESSNYYQLTLSSCADVIAGDILQFDTAGCSQSNTTSHTVTQAEVVFGGFECNIMLGPAESDTTPPIITNVANGTPTDSSVTITWDTDEASDSLVKYGTTSGVYTDDVSDMAMTTSHSIGLSGLSAGTTYYFVVNSTDASDNSNESEEHSFTTLSAADTTPPVITNVANGTPADSSVTITWDTDEASDSLVKYGTTSGVYTDDVSDMAMTASHSIGLSGLSAGTTYYFVVNSTDASGNSNESEEHSFTTAAEAITLPELVSCVITPTPPVVQGTNVSVDCLFSEDVDYEIRIENATGALIENIGSGTATNPDPKWWNTTTGTPAGTYTVNVTMDNSTSGLSSYNDTNTIEVIAAAEMPTVSIGSAEGSVGDTVDVSINITDALAIGAMDIRVAYTASILNATDVANGSMIESLPAPLVAYHLGYVDVNISFATYPEAINGDGELFIVTFDIIGGDAGDSAILALEADAFTNDTPPQPVGVVTKNGVVNVTDGAADITPPMVIGNSPTGTDVSGTADVTVTFNETMDQTSAEGAFSIMPDATGAFSWSGNIMTFTTAADLADNTTYDVTISTNAKDLAGNPLAEPFIWNFTTATVVPSSTTVSIEDVTVAPGESIVVPITIGNVSDMGSCQLTLSYDPDVVIVSNASQSDFDSLFTNLEDTASGSVSILAYQTSNPGLDGAVIVANVTFIAAGNSGSSTPLDLEVTTLTDATPDCNPIPYTIRDGSFTMFRNGDVNGDGMVDVADCMYLAKHLIGVSGFETIVEDVADVNGNGMIEASDCMYLAKHLAGMDGFEVLK